MTEFRMPALGADMEDGTVVEWKIAPGDTVKSGQVIVVVETHKGAIDVEIFEAGKVSALLAPAGTRVRVGEVLALLEGEPSESIAPSAPAAPAAAARPTAVIPATIAATTGARVKASPAARARAQELGIDLASVSGSGPSGAATREDVDRAAQLGKKTAPEAGDLRGVIAAAMTRSKREIPHYYLSATADFGPARAWLDTYNSSVPVTQRLLPVVPLLRAVSLAAASVSGFNGYFRAGAFQQGPAVHLGVAIALRGGGLVAPAILDAQDKSMPALMTALADLVARARTGHLRSSELAAGTLTVTSLGEEAVDAVFPIIYPPQIAIIGAGPVHERPWIAGGRIEPRPLMTLSLAADHRVTDGRAGARFLARICDLLQDPEKL